MKKIVVFILCSFFVGKVFSQAVSLETAKMVANNVYTQVTGMQKNAVTLTLYSDKTISNTHKSINQEVYYYIFNTSDSGFVIVSGDKRAIPVLAYSTEGNFDTTDMPDNIKWWFSTYEDQIDIAKSHSAVASIDLQQQWDECILNQPLKNRKGTAAVSALCFTKWGQGSPYNKFCPYDTAASQRTYTGCVATAMAQVMKYWNFPATGMGTHTSTDTTYGILTADFGHTSYAWDKMAVTNPATTDTNIALLMYHCGVALNMDYGTTGSSAYTYLNDYWIQRGYIDVPTALNNFFKYDSVQGYHRDSCTEAAWIAMLKAELDLSRPIVYAGTSNSGSGHAFVCDGYDNSNNFHMNWGWHGTSDGYFALSALNPGSLGVGGGSGGYNTNQRAVLHIVPSDTTIKLYNLQLNSNLSISDTVIKYKSPFSLSVQVANIGEGDFNGSFAVAIYDSLDRFVCYLEEKINQYIPSMGQDTLLFSTEGNDDLYVRSYTAILYYKSGSFVWKPIDGGLYTNSVKFAIIPKDPAPAMYLRSDMTISPTVVYKDSAFSITAQYINRGTLPFSGSYAVAVYDSNYQNVGFVAVKNNVSLQNGYYTNQTFTTKGMSLDSGNYYAVAMYKDSTDTAWQELKKFGATSPYYLPFTVKQVFPIMRLYSNITISPSMVIVSTPFTVKANIANFGTSPFVGKLRAEIVDEEGQEIELVQEKSISGLGKNTYTSCTFTSNGISLPVGTYYMTIQSQSENGEWTMVENGNYTNPVAFEVHDDVSVAENTFDEVSLSPNPTQGKISLRRDSDGEAVVKVIDIMGRVLSQQTISTKNFEIDLQSYANGTYIVSIVDCDHIINKKVVKR